MTASREFNEPIACSSSMTPSQQSDNDNDEDDEDEFEPDSDYESDNGGESFDQNGNPLNVQWIGPGRSVPIVIFDAEFFFRNDPNLKQVGIHYNLACKVAGDSQILREILTAHGFHEVDMNNRHYNLAWTGRHARPTYMKKMESCHIINHFPRTEELTRKDKLYHNIRKMQRRKGKKHFNFIPLSFVLPDNYRSFRTYHKREKGLYIVKPVSMSRGRGVFLINNPKESKTIFTENMKNEAETRCKTIVSKYISNPLIIDGYKFDLRIYVAVTSFDPLVIYMYNEGLTRFATVKYDLKEHALSERCMHLTNYSVNIENEDYIRNTDPEDENTGSKWSLGALLRHLKKIGIDSNAIMLQIEDVVIKTILSVEWKVAASCRRYVKKPHNCFELFGFDILLDENLKAWLLEVNLSPSLGCDTPLDIKIKGNMLCDLLNLVGIRCCNSHLQNIGRVNPKSIYNKVVDRLQKSYGHHYYTIIRDAVQQAWGLSSSRKRLRTMIELEKSMQLNSVKMSRSEKCKATNLLATLTNEEVEIIRRVREEENRRGGWVRIFPTAESWDTYKYFMDFPTTNNLMLHQRLYPARHSVMTAGRSPQAGTVTPSDSVNDLLLQMTGTKWTCQERISDSCIEELLRFKQYESPLRKVPPSNFRRKSENDLDENADIAGNMEPCASVKLMALNMDMKPVGPETEKFDKKKEKSLSSCPNSSVPVSLKQVDPGCVTSGTVRSTEENLQKVLDRLMRPYLFQERKRLDSAVTLSVASKYDVIRLVEEGYILSEEQARTVFSSYLIHVLKTLVCDFSGILREEEVDVLLDMMNLVLRFLKQAVRYLPQPFDLSATENVSALQEKRDLLAQLLADFISHYLEQQSTRKNRTLNAPGSQGDEGQLAKDPRLDTFKFNQFVFSADEKELETLLYACCKNHDLIPTFMGQLVDGKSNDIPNKAA